MKFLPVLLIARCIGLYVIVVENFYISTDL